MRTDLFDFELPEERIALHPASPRDAARLLVVPAGEAPFADRGVRDLPALLRAGDALVFNDTRVIPAALEGVRRRGDLRANVAVTLIERLADNRWRALARPAKRLQEGDRLHFGHDGSMCLAGALDATVAARGEAGEVEHRLRSAGRRSRCGDRRRGRDAAAALHRRHAAASRTADRADYQTIYAAHDGAVAAPTAGLHFTPELMAALDAARHRAPFRDAARRRRHVPAGEGRGHRRPQDARREGRDLRRDGGGAQRRARARRAHRRRRHDVAAPAGEPPPRDGRATTPSAATTDIFITPGYRFRAVDVLMTNFHLPRSTLFMLVAAFAGLETHAGGLCATPSRAATASIPTATPRCCSAPSSCHPIPSPLRGSG